MNKLIEQIDKLINKKGSLKTPAYYIRELFINIVEYVEKKVNSINDRINTINKKIANIANNSEYIPLAPSKIYNIDFKVNKEVVYLLTGTHGTVRKSHFNVVNPSSSVNAKIKLFFYINTSSDNGFVLHEVEVTCGNTVTINEDGFYVVNIYSYGSSKFIEVNKTDYIHP